MLASDNHQHTSRHTDHTNPTVAHRQARKKRKESEENGDSETHKAYDDWILAYENAAKLQYPGLDKLNFSESQTAAILVEDKGYILPPDQQRTISAKLSMIKQKDQEHTAWLDAGYPEKMEGKWSAKTPQMGQCGPWLEGSDLCKTNYVVQGCFVNSHFFDMVKAGASHKDAMHDMFVAFFKRHNAAKLGAESAKVMAPVEKTFKGFIELLNLPMKGVKHFKSTFEDVAYLCPWHEKFEDFKTKGNVLNELRNGGVYSDFLQQSKNHWRPMIDDYVGRMAAIHHRKPKLDSLNEKLQSAASQFTSVKKEPGVATDSASAIDALTEYRATIKDHRKELGKDRCEHTDKLAAALLETIASNEMVKDTRDTAKLRQLKDFAGDLGLRELSQKINDTLMEMEKSNLLQVLEEKVATKPSSFSGVVQIMEAWQKADNLHKPDRIYTIFFPNFVQCLVVVLSNSRNRELQPAQFQPIFKWLVDVARNHRFVNVNHIGNNTDQFVKETCDAADSLVVLTDAAKRVLEARKTSNNIDEVRGKLLVMHKAYVKCVDAQKRNFTTYKGESKLENLWNATAKFLTEQINGTRETMGYLKIITNFAKELFRGHHESLDIKEKAVLADAYGAGCSAVQPWHSLLGRTNAQQTKKLKEAYDKYLNTLDGPECDKKTDDLIEVPYVNSSKTRCPGTLCSRGAKAIEKFQVDAKSMGSYVELDQKKVDTTVEGFMKTVRLQKVTKAEYKILRKSLSNKADGEKKCKDCLKAREELAQRPWLVDFSEAVHPAVRALFEEMTK